MRLNLLPAPPPRIRSTMWIFVVASIGLIGLCVYLATSIYTARLQGKGIQATMAEQSASIASLQSQISSRQAMSQEVNLVTRLQQFHRIAGQPSAAVSSLLNLLDSGGHLTSLSYSHNQLTGVFQTNSLATAAQLVQAIESSPDFSQVSFTNIANISGGGALQLSFQISIGDTTVPGGAVNAR